MLKIKEVEPGGIGDDLDLSPGDIILAINDNPVRDLLDYYFGVAEEEVTLKVKTTRGELVVFEIEKDYQEDLGLEFEIRARQCGNKCVFCFIDQQPPGMRQTLYVKDDDYRLSFLHGNYITLTNLSTRDVDRIIKERVSPLYVSVHATNPRVRSEMLGRNYKANVLDMMLSLKREGIDFHAQIVLCPGYNDGEILRQTLEDLAKLEEGLLSLAVVPVGLTKHRQELATLKPVDEKVAKETLEIIDQYQTRFLEKYQRRIVFAADEFYLKAKSSVPQTQYYEDFAQLENGIGLIRRLFDQAEELSCLEAQPLNKAVLILTGMAAAPALKAVAEHIVSIFPGLTIQIQGVQNDYLGEQITVAGLLSGEDIFRTARNVKDWDILFVPGVAVRSDSNSFIDDWSLQELRDKLDKPVYGPEDIIELINILRNEV